MSKNQINCPNCGTSIDVQDILAHQLEDKIRQKYQADLAKEKKEAAEQLEKIRKDQQEAAEQLAKEKATFNENKRRENELFQERLRKQLDEEKKKLEEKRKAEKRQFEEEIKAKFNEENSEQLAALTKELNEKSEKVKELNKSRAEIERLKREQGELKAAAEAEAQKMLTESLKKAKEEIQLAERKAAEDKNELRFKEMQKQLEDQKKLTEEMKRKQEQGSMQLQGEVQELAIEEWLAAQFPLDTIDEIKKGARGGDCLQIVNTRSIQNCGTIYYESKRTKDFQPSWIEKFKADIRDKSANIGVLVTEVMPKGMDRMGLYDGIWICNYDEFKGLCAVLRESIIQLKTAMGTQENRGDKIHMLYDFLTSNTFRMQVEAIVEGFSQMKTDLESEKRSFARIWKQREKQIDKVTLNTIEMHASIKGIAGNAIQSVKALELPGEEDEDQMELL